MRGPIVALLCVLGSVTAARAQELTVGFSSYAPFGVDDLDGTLPSSGELRMTFATSERFAIEPFVTVARSTHGGRASGLEGFYGVQVRQRIALFTRVDAMLFATYGAAGYYDARTAAPPIIGHVGLGMRRHVFNALAVRAEVHAVTFHVVPIGARFVVGMSLDVGG